MKRKSTKMKELLTIVSLLLCGVAAEPLPQYPPSGWRPNGPAFELPARVPAQVPQKQEYLPPVDPRRPANYPDFDSGVDVSVQGLPTGEQQPLFQVSPINGQQYSGPTYQADIRSLDQTLQQIQYQQQLEKQREFARQRQFEAARGNANTNGVPNPQPPRQFVPQATPSTTTTTTQRPEFRTEATTESDLNEGEQYDDDKDSDNSGQKQKVSVEVTKQNIQEYPSELFLTPLAQFKIQPQFVQLPQLGQLRSPLYYQPIQQEPQKSEGFDGPAHLAALPSVLAQQQLIAAQARAPQPINQNPSFIIARGQEQPTPAYLVPAQQESNQFQPLNNQYQPIQPAQVQTQTFPQFQAQPVVLPPQTSNQLQPNPYTPQPQDTEQIENNDEQDQTQQPQPQFIYQAYQPQDVYQRQYPIQAPANQYQPQDVYQQQYPNQPAPANQYQPQDVYQQQIPIQAPANQYQPQEQTVYQPQPQLINYPAQDWNQYYQQEFNNPNQPQFQGQDSLQSGLDANQQGNGVDQEEGRDDEQNDGSRATAVATAFGTRTQPRVLPQYGVPVQRPQTNPGYPTTTEAPQEEVTEDGPDVAQATAVATGSRKSAKLRSRRVRPIFTLDRSGHLVLAQDQ